MMMDKQLKIILTGATGFVGEGVLLECLAHPQVAEVLSAGRKSTGRQHPKLRELIIPDFLETDRYATELQGYDACFFCAGISSAGLSEETYTHITYDLTLSFAETLAANHTGMVFNFVSGSHTDSTEQTRVMWARIKGKTENALSKLPFKAVYHFRPGGMIPTSGQHNSTLAYKIIVKVLAFLMPGRVSTMKEVGLSMINTAIKGYSKHILEITDIKAQARTAI